MSNSRSWYWTPERLEKLQQTLDGAAEHDSGGLYFRRMGLRRYVVDNGSKHGLSTDTTTAGDGLTILVFLGVLEPGRQGAQPLGYKRRYTPQDRPITWDDIARYRRSRGITSPTPRPRP